MACYTSVCGVSPNSGVTTMWTVIVSLLVHAQTVHMDNFVNVDAPREYCNMEMFNATCLADEVIVMQTARYGRMNFGRCVKGNYGFLGCAVDVLGYLDHKCSGFHVCRFSVPDSEMYKTTPCPGDFTSYLEASYRCVRVASVAPSRCHARKDLLIQGPTGFIASKITEDTGLGSMDCPWLIKVNAGQRINVTLLNFARIYKLPSSGRNNANMDACFDVLKITEGLTDRTVVKLCSRDQRESKMYISKTNKIKVEFLDRRVLKTIGNFMLKYEAISCPDVRPPPEAWARRDGDILMIRCNSSQETWYLTCRHDNWVGEIGNCSSDYKWSLAHVILDEETFPYGVLAVVAIGVVLGVFIGGVLLAVIFIVSKRNKRQQESRVFHDNKENMRILDSTNSNNSGALGTTTLPTWMREGQYTDEGIVRDMRSPIPHTRDRSRGDVTEHHVMSTDASSHRPSPGPHVCDVVPPNENFSTFRPKAHYYESPSVS